MNIKVTFKEPIEIKKDGYTAEVNFLICKSIELNGFGLVKIDDYFICSELYILKIEIV